jgi:hypothetical protein
VFTFASTSHNAPTYNRRGLENSRLKDVDTDMGNGTNESENNDSDFEDFSRKGQEEGCQEREDEFWYFDRWVMADRLWLEQGVQSGRCWLTMECTKGG